MQRIAADVRRPQGGDASDGAATPPPRPLPELDLWNRAFWTGGAEGRLMITRCAACGYWIHPPGPVCPQCLSREVGAQQVSGRGRVYTFTVNHQQWHPAFTTPYVIALVELDEQPQLRVVTNIVGCEPDAVRLGMRVEVCFEHVEDVFIPVFCGVDQA